MVRGLQVATLSLVMLALAASTASAQQAREYPLNLGLGFSFSGFGNPPIVLNEDCVAVISEGFQAGASLSDGGLLVMSGLASGLVNFQFLTWGGVVAPFTTMTRRTFKLSESSVVYLGTAEWDGGNGHLIVFKGVGSGGAPDVTLHANLDVNLWPKGWGVPLVFDAETMVLPAPGPDRWLGTGDDLLVICQGLGTPWFQASTIGLGSGLASTLTMLPSGLGVTVASGGDGMRGTNDDILVTVRFVAGTFSVNTSVPGLPLGSWTDSDQPLVVGDDDLLFPTTTGLGAPATGTTAAFTLLRDINTGPVAVPLHSIPAGGLTSWGAPRPVRLGADAVAHLSPGPDLQVQTADDEVVVISGLPGTPLITAYPAGQPVGASMWPMQPRLLGDLLVTGTFGPDGFFATGDDGLLTVAGLAQGMPTFSHVPLGDAALDINIVNQDGVWTLMFSEAPIFVGGLQGPFPTVAPAPGLQPQSSLPMRINDWTQLVTQRGTTSGGLLNDIVRLIHFPFVEDLGTGSPGWQGQIPGLATAGLPSIGGGWLPILLSGAMPNSPAALFFSRRKDVQPLTATSTLLIDPDELTVNLVGSTGTLGSSTFMMQMPTDPNLAGRSWACQGVILDAFAADGFTLTNGLVIHL